MILDKALAEQMAKRTAVVVVLGLIGCASATEKVSVSSPRRPKAPKADASPTARSYQYVAARKLPPVKTISSYRKLTNDTLRIAVAARAGAAALIYANSGLAAAKEWTTTRGGKFKVELQLFNDPARMRDAFAAGKVHIASTTLGMLALFNEELRKDPRIMPRVFQQLGWSNGGHGIVTRGPIKSINDLRGKTIVLAQSSPSELFIRNVLVNAGVPLSEVKLLHTPDSAQAATAFRADKTINACVLQAPDLHSLSKAPANTLVLSTRTANALIAGVWFARTDFARDHPAIIEGLVRGIFDASADLDPSSLLGRFRAATNRQKVARLIASALKITTKDARMLSDVRYTNYAENRAFFLDRSNPTNFERSWNTASDLYQGAAKITTKTPFHRVMDASAIKRLSAIARYTTQKVRPVAVSRKSAQAIKAETAAILTKTVVIHFFPNSWDLEKRVSKRINNKQVRVLYDARVPSVIEEIAELAGQYSAARIVIEGHTDGSMKGRVPFEAGQKLSFERAKAVGEALVRKFKIDANRLAVEGIGWREPADENDPNNHAKNRRVQVKVYPISQDR